MTLAPLLAATPVIQAHAYAALLAAGLSLHQFFARPGTLTHKALGYVWVAAMATAAASSFFIHSIRSVGPFSAIHLLSIFVLVNLTRAVLAARADRTAPQDHERPGAFRAARGGAVHAAAGTDHARRRVRLRRRRSPTMR